jgi:glucokinase
VEKTPNEKGQDMNRSGNLFIGIDLGGTQIKGGLVGGDGRIIADQSVPTGASEPAGHTLGQMASLIRVLMEKAERPKSVAGVGIGLAGQVDHEKGVYVEGPNVPNWKNVPVTREIERIIDLPVVIDNDAHVAALGEYAYGAGRGVAAMLMVTLGTGVGGCVVLDGRLYRGKNNTAGEFGHTTIQHDGPLCACGRRGCVEAFIGTQGILRRTREKLMLDRSSILHGVSPNEMEPRHVGEAAEKGDLAAQAVLRDIGEYLGAGLANVVNLLNIEKAVIGGGVSNAGEWIFQSARERLAKDALKVPGGNVQLVRASLGNLAGIVGAAKLAMEGV